MGKRKRGKASGGGAKAVDTDAVVKESLTALASTSGTDSSGKVEFGSVNEFWNTVLGSEYVDVVSAPVDADALVAAAERAAAPAAKEAAEIALIAVPSSLTASPAETPTPPGSGVQTVPEATSQQQQQQQCGSASVTAQDAAGSISAATETTCAAAEQPAAAADPAPIASTTDSGASTAGVVPARKQEAPGESKGKVSTWYQTAASYWISVEPTVDGMLGGLGKLSSIDVQGSSKFLQSLPRQFSVAQGTVALDCGAGIGRVTRHLLLNFAETVDLVDQCPTFVDKAPEYFSAPQRKRIGKMIVAGLQDFVPTPGRYNLIWVQWVLNYLTDADLVVFLRRCAIGLAPHGMIVLKENTCAHGFVLDEADSSVTRTTDHFKVLIHRAGLNLVRERPQVPFPKDLLPVRMFALQPATGKKK